MMKRLGFLLIMAACAAPARATILAQTIDTVAGQADLTRSFVNSLDAKGFIGPNSVVIDTTTGMLFAADAQNHRVLFWNNRLTAATGQAADGVIGQADFLSGAAGLSASRLNFPLGLARDSAGRLWVGDAGNNRVLRFSPPFSTGMSADRVLGQALFTTNGAAAGAAALNNPLGVTFDGSGNLWVADSVNNRALRYAPPFTDGMSATLVLGQTNFTNNGAALTQTGMDYPYSVAVDTATSGVFVADKNNRRVLVFNPALSNGMAATYVIGQPNFTSNGSAATGDGVNSVDGVASDGSGGIWVGDDGNARLLKYEPPFATAMSAALVIGQIDFTSGGDGIAADKLKAPRIAGFDFVTGDLWVPDALNHRVMKFSPPLSTGMSASVVLGQLDFTHGQGNIVEANGLNAPRSVSIDTATGRAFIVDQENARVLWWDSIQSLTDGKAADGVIGQTSLLDSVGPVNTVGYNTFGGYPTGVEAAPDGGVWVTDNQCHRVVRFDGPLTSGSAFAVYALGQPDATTCSGGSTSQSTFNNASAVVSDAAGNLWVADTDNNRVLQFQPPFFDGMNAAVVLGQGGFGTAASGFTATTLSAPRGVAVDPSGNLWVADTANHRVLRFPKPQTDGMAADLVLGQSVFTSSFSAVDQSHFSTPRELDIDSAGNLWVADAGAKRVLVFNPPFSSGMNAAALLGQPNFTTVGGSASATRLGTTWGLALDGNGHVLVGDAEYNRAALYRAPAKLALVSAAVTTNTVTWSWPNDAAATGYRFYPSTGGAALSLGAGVTTLTQNGLTLATNYQGRVAGVYAFGVGPISSTATATTASSSTVSSAGATLTFTQAAGDSMLVIPAGAFPAGVSVTLKPALSLPSGGTSFSTALTGLGVGLEVNLDPGTQPLQACRITIPYQQSDVNGVNEDTLVLARWDPAAGVWVPQKSVVDGPNRLVTADVRHFSLFQLMALGPSGDVSNPKAFPNPFRPALGHTSVTFANLPAAAKLTIFTLAGRKVQELSADGAGLASWDGRNAWGAPVASGVYFVLAQGRGGVKTFKIIVQR
jgi:sugar lactone lactonase YvrE